MKQNKILFKSPLLSMNLIAYKRSLIILKDFKNILIMISDSIRMS